MTGREVLRATRTPEGTATIHLSHRSDHVIATAWGRGATWVLDRAPALIGSEDAPVAFRPEHPLISRLHAANPGLKMCRSHAPLELMIPTILGQKVTTEEATRSYAALVRRYGEPAPGPGGLRVPPAPSVLAEIPYFALHPLGIERKRAETIRRACVYERHITRAAELGPTAFRSEVEKIAGIGPWTSAIVAQGALGDPDAVIVGDYHLPNIVGWALAGRTRSNDDEMLELLRPFAGERGRVVRLLVSSGARAPAFGPRHRIRNIAAM